MREQNILINFHIEIYIDLNQIYIVLELLWKIQFSCNYFYNLYK